LINENSETIDAVQEAALKLTDLIGTLQSLAFKYNTQVALAIIAIRPQVKAIPGLENLPAARLISETGSLNQNIVSYISKAKEIVDNLSDALTHSDATKIKIYLQEIQEMKARIDGLLASPTSGPADH
jgi:hypothetical protein